MKPMRCMTALVRNIFGADTRRRESNLKLVKAGFGRGVERPLYVRAKVNVVRKSYHHLRPGFNSFDTNGGFSIPAMSSNPSNYTATF